MSYSQKYTIVQFLEPVQEHQTFSMDDWPVHLTVADVFAVELSNSLFEQIRNFLATKESIVVKAQGDTILGSGENTVKVSLIENSYELQSLHDGLVDLLRKNGAVFNSPQYTHEGFLPHSTIQKHLRIESGQDINVVRLSLVDMYVNHDWRQRKILETFR